MKRKKKKREGGRRSFRDMIKMSDDSREEAADEPSPRDRPSGVIRFETGKLPAEFAGFDEKGKSSLLPGKVVMTIVILAIAIIAVIAWLIASEPPK